MLLEIWVLGAIMALVGILLIACGFGHIEFGLYFSAAGITSTGIGSLVFFSGFKRWVENL